MVAPNVTPQKVGLRQRIKRIFNRQAAVQDLKSNEISTSYCEHTWDLERLAANYPNSNIAIQKPSNSVGLSSTDAVRLNGELGLNALPKAKQMSDLQLFLKQFTNLLWILLLAASTLSLVGYLADTSVLSNLYITIIMYVMIFVMCTISWWQEREAIRAVQGFANLLPQSCAVIRDGKEISVAAPLLTVGDIIIIKNGNRVPADARILECNELKLEQSSITGEAEPIEFHAKAVGEEVSVFESRNVAFNGSMCVDGSATAIVLRIGADTVIGQIASLTTGQRDKGSSLERELLRFIKFLIITAVSISVVIFIVGGFNFHWKHVILLLANGFLVCCIGMVPCGLPATVTSILTIVARSLAKKQVYLKRLDVVEALGAVSIIASDKTGTLTKNIMTVTDVWYCNQKVQGFFKRITEGGKSKEPEQYGKVPARLLTLMSVCNVAKFVELTEEEEKHESKGTINPAFTTIDEGSQLALNTIRKPATGSASEIAMLHYADALIDVNSVRKSHNMVFEIGFNSLRKWHLQIHREGEVGVGQSEFRLMMKGAPEILLKRCDKIMTDEGAVELTAAKLKEFQSAYDGFGEEGRRVIGYIETVFTAPTDTVFKADAQNFPVAGLTFCGMTAIMDPPRDETAASIQACKRAGIRVFMVTGDHPSTAEAIAIQIGLITKPEAKSGCVVHGENIPKMTDQDWDSILLNRHLVFARTTPEQKLKIVEECQKRGELIAMTGDGVNDSPALKKANVGVAMGSGSEVAKQAADIILMDDNFSSIVLGIERGRLMFDNVKKLLGYTMPHSFPEIAPVCLNFVLGLPMGITSLQILTIDLGSELGPGIAMSQEKIEDSVMTRPPRNGKKLVSNGLLIYGYVYAGLLHVGACLVAYLFVFWHHGINTNDLLFSAADCWQEGGKNFTSNGKTFDWPQQKHIMAQACSAWHIGIVFVQWWHVWACRTRRESIFTHGLLSNKYTIVGVTAEILILCFCVYCPGFNTWIGGAPPPWEVWLIIAGFGIFINFYNEIRKLIIRRAKKPHSLLIKFFKW